MLNCGPSRRIPLIMSTLNMADSGGSPPPPMSLLPHLRELTEYAYYQVHVKAVHPQQELLNSTIIEINIHSLPLIGITGCLPPGSRVLYTHIMAKIPPLLWTPVGWLPSEY